jgi:dTDP-4-amino-4,6-dideoxygalactose transaminase
VGTLQTHFPKLKENDAVLFSTGWGKPLSFMGGGFLCGNNVEAGLAWKEWRDCRLTPAKSVRKQMESLAILLGGSRKIFNLTLRAGQWRGAQGLLGKNESSLWRAEYNRGLSTICFRLGMKRLGELNKIRLQRKQQVEFYRRNLSGKISDLCLPEGDHLSHFSLRTPRRDSLHYFLKQRGIFTSHKLFSQLLSDIPSFKGDIWGDLTYAKKLVDETIHLPLFFSLTEEDQSYICEQVIAWDRFEKFKSKSEIAELAWGRA